MLLSTYEENKLERMDKGQIGCLTWRTSGPPKFWTLTARIMDLAAEEDEEEEDEVLAVALSRAGWGGRFFWTMGAERIDLRLILCSNGRLIDALRRLIKRE